MSLRTSGRDFLPRRALPLDDFAVDYKSLKMTTLMAGGEEKEKKNDGPFSRRAIPVFDGGRGSVDRGARPVKDGRRSLSRDCSSGSDGGAGMDLGGRRALWESSIPEVDRSLYYGRSYVPWTGTYL